MNVIILFEINSLLEAHLMVCNGAKFMPEPAEPDLLLHYYGVPSKLPVKLLQFPLIAFCSIQLIN